jgi:uncharacterized protein YndB with AHSA1/START domain
VTEVRARCPDDATVVLTANVPLDRAAAFRAFTDPAELGRWFWPARLQADITVEPAVGGVWRARSEVIGMGFTARFGQIVPDERLVVSWQWDDDDAVSDVVVDFADAGGGSTVTLTHGANPTVAARDEHRAGWTDCLGRLAQL